MISIVVPCYNCENTLKITVDHLLSQTDPNYQIVLVDDGSTDNSLSILREYERIDKRIKVITGNNENAGAARNKGIEMATGKYLYFPDSDDYCELSLLEEAYSEAEAKNADIIIFKSK